MSGPPVLELRGVCQRFGATEVLRHVDLAVRPGERVALIGPNGAGKSTLFDVVSGVQRPSSGRVWLQQRRIDGRSPQRINRWGLGRGFQITQLFANMTVWEQVRCAFMWRQGWRYRWWVSAGQAAALDAQAEALLAQVGLWHRRDGLAQALTYAEQRALDLAMAVASAGAVLLLDEPTAGMSRSETTRFVGLIRALTEGLTLLLVEHDMGVVFELADRVAVLDQGVLIAFDTPSAVRDHPRVRAAYLGQVDAAGV